MGCAGIDKFIVIFTFSNIGLLNIYIKGSQIDVVFCKYIRFEVPLWFWELYLTVAGAVIYSPNTLIGFNQI